MIHKAPPETPPVATTSALLELSAKEVATTKPPLVVSCCDQSKLPPALYFCTNSPLPTALQATYSLPGTRLVRVMVCTVPP